VALVIGALAVSFTLWWFAEPVMQMLAGGFDPELQIKAARLLGVGSVAIVFGVIEAILRSRLLAAKKFALSGLSYVWQSVGIIAAAVWWREAGAMGLMWGLVVGTALSALWNLLLLVSSEDLLRRDYEPLVTVFSPGRIVMWVSIVLVSDSLPQLYSVVDRYMGSYLQAGAIAALNYASLTAGLPTSIIGLAISTAILPFLSDADSANDVDRTRSIMDLTIRWALLIAVPIAVWMLIFRTEIIAFLFFRGAFDADALRVTSSALSAAAFGITPVALAVVWSRPFYASRSWKPIMIIAVGALIAKTIFSVALVPRFGSSGLALSTSCAYVATAALSGYMQRDHIRPYWREWLVVGVKALVLVGVPAIAGYAIIEFLDIAQSSLRVLIAGGSIAVGAAILALAGHRWGISQMSELTALIRFRRS
jgi:putative peptidoglycan lipid II flippase